jgi:hypothetical protein
MYRSREHILKMEDLLQESDEFANCIKFLVNDRSSCFFEFINHVRVSFEPPRHRMDHSLSEKARKRMRSGGTKRSIWAEPHDPVLNHNLDQSESSLIRMFHLKRFIPTEEEKQ